MEWEELTPEQKDCVKGMVWYCLEHNIGLGQDEGYTCLETFTPNEERKALEKFCQ